MRLVCCPAASLDRAFRAHEPSHVLTLASPGRRPAPLADAARLHLAFNDVAEPGPGLVPPSEADVRRLLAFGRSWDGAQPLLVSCEAGVSRSTAALFALACDRRPDLPEALLAARLREASPCATPNPLVVSLADRILGRRDRMIRAVAAIGRGADYRPYGFFEIRLPGPA